MRIVAPAKYWKVRLMRPASANKAEWAAALQQGAGNCTGKCSKPCGMDVRLTSSGGLRLLLLLQAIWLELQETVHAVDAMSTKTPQEAAA